MEIYQKESSASVSGVIHHQPQDSIFSFWPYSFVSVFQYVLDNTVFIHCLICDPHFAGKPCVCVCVYTCTLTFQHAKMHGIIGSLRYTKHNFQAIFNFSFAFLTTCQKFLKTHKTIRQLTKSNQAYDIIREMCNAVMCLPWGVADIWLFSGLVWSDKKRWN